MNLKRTPKEWAAKFNYLKKSPNNPETPTYFTWEHAVAAVKQKWDYNAYHNGQETMLLESEYLEAIEDAKNPGAVAKSQTQSKTLIKESK